MNLPFRFARPWQHWLLLSALLLSAVAVCAWLSAGYPLTPWENEPVLPGWAVFLIALALLCPLLVGPVYRPIGQVRQILLVSLRLGVLLLVVVMMMRPSCDTQRADRQRGTLVILFDQSRSMSLPGTSGEGASRWDDQRRLLKDSQPLLTELANVVDVKIFAYDRELHEIEFKEGEIAFPDGPQGDRTDMGGPLYEASVTRQTGGYLAGAILLGDGAQTALDPEMELFQAAEELARRDKPLYTVAFGPTGDAAHARDVAVENLPDQYSVFVKNELLVRGTLRVQDWVNKEIEVELLVEDAAGKSESAGRRTLVARESDEQIEVSIPYVPERPGQYKLTLKAAEIPGELVTKNNHLSAFLTVFEGGLKVLYLEGSLRSEQIFLRRSLDASQDMELEFRWIDQRLRDSWPQNLAAELSDEQIDVFILGDLDAGALSPESQQALADAVAGGKGLIMLGGYHSFGPGGWRDTPLAGLLPLEFDRFERQDFDAPIRKDLHREGPLKMLPAADHFLTRLGPAAENDETWRNLPPLTGANKFEKLKSAAGVRVLAETEDGLPLLVSGDVGGRVLAFAGDSTWRWWMQGHSDEHKRFWRQVVLWLARRDDLRQDDVWLQLSQRRFQPGARVEFIAGAKSAAGDTIPGASFEVVVVPPGGEQRPLSLVREGEGVSGVVADTMAPGYYTIRLSARDGQRELGTAESVFEVYDHDVELAASPANPQQLSRLAGVTRESGGRLLAEEELAGVLRDLRDNPPRLEIVHEHRWRLADHWVEAWSLFLLVCGLLCTEWFVRKWWLLV